MTTHSEAIINPPASAKLYKDSWEFDLYVNELNGAIKSDIFKHQSWIQFYYTWAGFQNYNLVVRVNVLLQSCLTLFFFFFVKNCSALNIWPLSAFTVFSWLFLPKSISLLTASRNQIKHTSLQKRTVKIFTLSLFLYGWGKALRKKQNKNYCASWPWDWTDNPLRMCPASWPVKANKSWTIRWMFNKERSLERTEHDSSMYRIQLRYFAIIVWGPIAAERNPSSDGD